jgi:hypothetical protein
VHVAGGQLLCCCSSIANTTQRTAPDCTHLDAGRDLRDQPLPDEHVCLHLLVMVDHGAALCVCVCVCVVH